MVVINILFQGRRSLLSLLDNSLTIGGKKLLRSNLLQPSTDPSIIDARLDAVEALLEDEMVDIFQLFFNNHRILSY